MTPTNNNGWIWPNFVWSYSPVQVCCLNDFFHLYFFGHIHPFKFVVLIIFPFILFQSYSPVQFRCLNDIFHLYFFGHIHQFFGQVQRLMFIGVIFRSCSNVHVRLCEYYSVIFKPIIGHIGHIDSGLIWNNINLDTNFFNKGCSGLYVTT